MRIQFQMTPGTECPVEMNFFFPDRRALCMAENATHNLHNILTLRGAVVRDARIWSRYLNEAIDLFADDSRRRVRVAPLADVGTRPRSSTYLSQQRDLYAYLHDQTLRLMNQGYTGIEIAEMIEMPPALEAAWHTHGYYGSVSHNVKAIYQRYLGWFDGNPAHLWQHPPVEAAARGTSSAWAAPTRSIAKAQGYVDDGDLRFAAELLNHVVFADETEHGRDATCSPACTTRSATAPRTAPGATSTCRAPYELRNGVAGSGHGRSAGGTRHGRRAERSTSSSTRSPSAINGPKAWDEHLAIDWVFTDLGHTYRTELTNGVLIQDVDPTERAPPTSRSRSPSRSSSVCSAVRTARHARHRRRPRCGAAPALVPRPGQRRLPDRHAIDRPCSRGPTTIQRLHRLAR